MIWIEPSWSPRQKRNLASLSWQAAWIAKGAKVLSFKGMSPTGRSNPDYGMVLFLNKTMVIRDADTMLSDPNLSAVLKEARDLYDRRAESDS